MQDYLKYLIKEVEKILNKFGFDGYVEIDFRDNKTVFNIIERTGFKRKIKLAENLKDFLELYELLKKQENEGMAAYLKLKYKKEQNSG